MLENITMIPLETREFMADEDLKATKTMVRRAINKCYEMRIEHLEKLGIDMKPEEKAYWDDISSK